MGLQFIVCKILWNELELELWNELWMYMQKWEVVITISVKSVGNREIYRSFVARLYQHTYWELNESFTTATPVLSFWYVKEYANTALRLTASGDHGLTNDNTNDVCAIWLVNHPSLIARLTWKYLTAQWLQFTEKYLNFF